MIEITPDTTAAYGVGFQDALHWVQLNPDAFLDLMARWEDDMLAGRATQEVVNLAVAAANVFRNYGCGEAPLGAERPHRIATLQVVRDP